MLEIATNGNVNPLILFIGRRVEQAMNVRLKNKKLFNLNFNNNWRF
jgi:hypothetical protein